MECNLSNVKPIDILTLTTHCGMDDAVTVITLDVVAPLLRGGEMVSCEKSPTCLIIDRRTELPIVSLHEEADDNVDVNVCQKVAPVWKTSSRPLQSLISEVHPVPQCVRRGGNSNSYCNSVQHHRPDPWALAAMWLIL